MSSPLIKAMLANAEPLAAISLSHLTAASREKLLSGKLSVAAVYPNEYGGFVYVGTLDLATPEEPDLARIVTLARKAGLIWLKFDVDARAVDGLLTYEGQGEAP